MDVEYTLSGTATEPVSWDTAVRHVRAAAEADSPVEALIQLVDHIRPSSTEAPAVRLASLVRHLERTDNEDGQFLGAAILTLLSDARTVHTLTDAGVPRPHQGFWSELAGRLGRRMLPEPSDLAELDAILETIFHREDDYVWIRRVPIPIWIRFLDAIGIRADSMDRVPAELSRAIRVLVHHVTSLGLQPEITERLPHLEGPSSPFFAISDVILKYVDRFDVEASGGSSREVSADNDKERLLERALSCLVDCRQAVDVLRAEKDVYGTNLSLTILTQRLLRQIERLEVLLHLTEPAESDFRDSAVLLFRALVRAVNTRNHVLPHIRQSADLLAYQVVEFAARKGSRYITRSPREYAAFFVSSLGGGVIVAFFALLKIFLDRLEVSLAAEAFLFGINYSICFILIYLTGSTLATKQPAMTANTIARTLGGASDHDIQGLKDLVVRTWRSQFVSFVGNLVMAFPVALLLAEAFHYFLGAAPAPPAKAAALLADNHPWHSGALPYAAVAGVFLFLAGLVSGYVDNRNRFSNIPLRVSKHPWLQRRLGLRCTDRLAGFVDRNLGILAGNIFLGFCLGSAGTVGEILGLPIDIRHIAFSSAHFGIAIGGLNWQISTTLALEITMGVMLIGLLNFLVSFGLSMGIAMESRQVTFRETRALLKGLVRHAVRRPLDYFIPPLGRRKSAAR